MKNSITFKNLTLDARDYASQGNAILGIRDSGKSYTATYVAESLMDAGIPIVAFDPIGLWRFLRVPGREGNRAYPIVVAGGEHGDLPLTVASAPEIVRAAMRSGVSLVFDLYSMDLSKADWKRIVADCVKVMLYENKNYGLRHIFLEESAEFCPQRIGPDQGKVYAEIEKLARMGGNALLGYTLINQRAEEVNKAVLELCDGLFLHRQKGRNSLVALTKWMDVAGTANGKKIIGTLPTLPQGECWAWPAGEDKPVHIKVPAKQTFQPDRRAMRDAKQGDAIKPMDVSEFVTGMKASLEAFVAEAEANDPERLKARIRELEKAGGAGSIDITNRNQIERNQAYDNGYNTGLIEGLAEGKKLAFHQASRDFADISRDFMEDINSLHKRLGGIHDHFMQMGIEESLDIPDFLRKKIAPSRLHHEDKQGKLVIDDPQNETNAPTKEFTQIWLKERLPERVKPAQTAPSDMSQDTLLEAAISVWPVKMTWGGLASMCGLKARGGSFNTRRRRLIDQGYIREEGNLVVLSKPPTSQSGIIPADKLEEALPEPAKKMFKIIRKVPGLNSAAVAGKLGIQPRGGSWNNGMSILRRNGLIVEKSTGEIYIEPTLLGKAGKAA